MNVIITIKYLVYSYRSEQSGSFPLRCRKPEEVALGWMKDIRRHSPDFTLEKIIVDGQDDITDKVKSIDVISEDNLPF